MAIRKKTKGAKLAKSAKAAENPKNQKAHAETLKRMKKELKDALSAFCRDAPKNDPKAFIKDAKRLKLLFGECQYMANEYKKLMPAKKR